MLLLIQNSILVHSQIFFSDDDSSRKIVALLGEIPDEAHFKWKIIACIDLVHQRRLSALWWSIGSSPSLRNYELSFVCRVISPLEISGLIRIYAVNHWIGTFIHQICVQKLYNPS